MLEAVLPIAAEHLRSAMMLTRAGIARAVADNSFRDSWRG